MIQAKEKDAPELEPPKASCDYIQTKNTTAMVACQIDLIDQYTSGACEKRVNRWGKSIR